LLDSLLQEIFKALIKDIIMEILIRKKR